MGPGGAQAGKAILGLRGDRTRILAGGQWEQNSDRFSTAAGAGSFGAGLGVVIFTSAKGDGKARDRKPRPNQDNPIMDGQ